MSARERERDRERERERDRRTKKEHISDILVHASTCTCVAVQVITARWQVGKLIQTVPSKQEGVDQSYYSMAPVTYLFSVQGVSYS